MLKHVQMSPGRSTLRRAGRKADNISIDSSRSYSPMRATLAPFPYKMADSTSNNSSRGSSPMRSSLANKFDTISISSSRDCSPLRTSLQKTDVDSYRGFSTLRASRARSSQRSDGSNSSSSSGSMTSSRKSPRCRSSPRELVRDAVHARQGLGGLEATMSSRSSSYTSLNDTLSSTGSTSGSDTPMTILRVHTRYIHPDLEYRTMSVKHTTTCREIVEQLLSKFRLKHRDPKLFNICLEVATRGTGSTVKTVLDLDDDACPAQLQACYPRAESRFTIRTRQGGAVKVVDSVLMAGSLYKSLMISERTTAQEVIQLLLNYHDSADSPSSYSLYEVCDGMNYENKLHKNEFPLELQMQRESTTLSDFSFVLKKRPALTPRTGREFPLRRSQFVRWSRSRQSLRPVEHQRRSAPLAPLPSCESEDDSDDDDVFYI